MLKYGRKAYHCQNKEQMASGKPSKLSSWDPAGGSPCTIISRGVQALLSQQGARSRHPRFPDSQQVQLLSWQFCSLLPPLMIPLGSCHPPPLPLVPSERLQGADLGWSFLSLGASVQWYGRGWTEPLQSHWVEGFHADSQHESLQIHGSWMEKQKYRNWDRTGWSIWRPNLLVILRTPQSVAVGSASTQQC